MSTLKSYFEQLFKIKSINIDKGHLALFDRFLQDRDVEAAFTSIQNIQTCMTAKWKEIVKIEEIQSKQLVLTNGTVGKAYEFFFDFSQKIFSDIGEFSLEFDEKIGITFDKEDNKISGVLKEAGEHILLMNFKLKNATEELGFHQKQIKLLVNPDPKSLWKNLASDRDDPYWKEDDLSTFFEFGSKTLVIGSKRGRSHAHEAKFRDDDFDFSFNEDTGWGVIAVADGAGSARYSRKGSKIACEAITDFFCELDNESMSPIESAILEVLETPSEETYKKLSGYFIKQLGEAAFRALSEIRKEASSQNAELRDFSTTLIFAFVKKIREKFVIASFWVGDGGIGIYDKTKNEVFVLGTPDSGEFAGQTRFLTMSDTFAEGAYANRIRFKIVENFTALILMTDGITDPKFQTDANLNRIEKWDELWDDLSGLNPDDCKVDFSAHNPSVEIQLMSWLDFWSPGNHDDRTIAILF